MLNGFGDARAGVGARSAGCASEYGVDATYGGADISQRPGSQAWWAEAAQTLRPVDILVNNAGVAFYRQ